MPRIKFSGIRVDRDERRPTPCTDLMVDSSQETMRRPYRPTVQITPLTSLMRAFVGDDETKPHNLPNSSGKRKISDITETKKFSTSKKLEEVEEKLDEGDKQAQETEYHIHEKRQRTEAVDHGRFDTIILAGNTVDKIAPTNRELISELSDLEFLIVENNKVEVETGTDDECDSDMHCEDVRASLVPGLQWPSQSINGDASHNDISVNANSIEAKDASAYLDSIIDYCKKLLSHFKLNICRETEPSTHKQPCYSHLSDLVCSDSESQEEETEYRSTIQDGKGETEQLEEDDGCQADIHCKDVQAFSVTRLHDVSQEPIHRDALYTDIQRSIEAKDTTAISEHTKIYSQEPGENSDDENEHFVVENVRQIGSNDMSLSKDENITDSAALLSDAELHEEFHDADEQHYDDPCSNDEEELDLEDEVKWFDLQDHIEKIACDNESHSITKHLYDANENILIRMEVFRSNLRYAHLSDQTNDHHDTIGYMGQSDSNNMSPNLKYFSNALFYRFSGMMNEFWETFPNWDVRYKKMSSPGHSLFSSCSENEPYKLKSRRSSNFRTLRYRSYRRFIFRYVGLFMFMLVSNPTQEPTMPIVIKQKRYTWIKRNKKNHRKKISTTTTELMLPDDVGLEKAYIEQEPDNIKLTQPPSTASTYQEYARRLSTFQHCDNLPVAARDLATAGFFLTRIGYVRCYSCLKDWPITEVNDPSSNTFHSQSCNTRWERICDRRQMASDTPGRVSDEIGDPPGQQSVYIPPGDVRNETYRLSTFEQFPVTCAISRRGLAKAGFYYTGFFDRVKCFACGRSIERWEGRDSPTELRWHKPDCPFPRGDPCGNIPINDIFNRLSSNSVTRQSQQRDEVIHQTDPNTGAIIRTVRYPSDLPERIRRSGGTFHIGPGNALTIQSGPGSSGSNVPVHIGNQSYPNNPPEQRPFRLANVVSPDHRRFLSNLYLNRELDRLSSFGRWPVSRPTITPAALAKSGFFYLGDMDRTQCFSCSGVLRNWTIEDDADDEHRNHFPNCKMVLRTEVRNVAIPEEDPTPENREQLFPCQYPSNPHMRNEAVRLATFDQRWPRGAVGAAPAVIAQAGFFFLGERDRVKCWYCNGGLQNWEYEDLPWIEHAKWFPNCQFVLQKQGVRFVYRNLSLYPHLNRPIIARQEGATIDPAGTHTPRALLAGMSRGGGEDVAPVVRQPSPPPTIIDPQAEMRKKKERITNIIKNSDIVKTVTGMGFSEESVRHVLEDKMDSGNVVDPNNIFESASSLLDAVMQYEDNKMQEEEEEQRHPPVEEEPSNLSFHSMSLSGAIGGSLGPAPGSGLVPQVSSFAEDEEMMEDRDMYSSISESVFGQGITQNSIGNVPPANKKSLQETLEKMEEERQCKVCFSNPADMVFVPCGHMICCMDCTGALRICPVCRKKIEKAIKTYVK